MMPDPWREKWVSPCGRAICYLGDNRDVWPTLARPDAIVSDPPYGQGLCLTVHTCTTGKQSRRAATVAREVVGDNGPFDPAPWADAADNVLLWGAHKFHVRLPDGGRWLFWDKRGEVLPEWDQGCGEMAWHNQPGPVRVCRLIWGGLVMQAGAKADHPKREHPTEKPIRLMSWCLEQAKVQPGQLVADPFMGSGTTGVACMRHGARFVGIEIDEGYFRTACRRIAEAARQPDLLIAETHA
jgi:tRNA G10  N-methylase Trm11